MTTNRVSYAFKKKKKKKGMQTFTIQYLVAFFGESRCDFLKWSKAQVRRGPDGNGLMVTVALIAS